MPHRAISTAPRRHQLASINEAAECVHVHPNTMRRWIAGGRLTAYAAGPRLIRVDINELDAMLLRPLAGGPDAAA